MIYLSKIYFNYQKNSVSGPFCPMYFLAFSRIVFFLLFPHFVEWEGVFYRHFSFKFGVINELFVEYLKTKHDMTLQISVHLGFTPFKTTYEHFY